MAKEQTNKMTFDEALKILKGDIYLCPLSQLQEAIRIVREQDPNNPVLKETLEALRTFEKENNLTEESAKVYKSNQEELKSLCSDMSFEKFKSAAGNKDIAAILERTEITDGKGADNKILDAKTKDAYLNLLFEGAKLKAETLLAGDKTFSGLNKRDRAKLLKDEIKTIFFADFAQTAIASSLDAPNKKEQKIGTPEYREYVVRQSKKAMAVFNSIIQGGKKIRIKVDSVLSSCADTAIQVERYISALKRKAQAASEKVADSVSKVADQAQKSVKAGMQKTGQTAENEFTKLAAAIQTKKNNFEKLANKVSQNRYVIWKNIKGSFSDNKFKLIGNIIANAGFGFWTATAVAGAAGTAAAPVLVPALAAYAAYHAAGSWVFPIIAEMRKINRQKKEAGEEPLKFKDALKQAWKNKMGSRTSKRSYFIGGVLNTGLATVGFTWLKDGLEAADAAVSLTNGIHDGLNTTLAANIAETRHAISLGRTGTASVAQLTDATIAYAVSAKDPDNKEKSAEFKQTAVAALAGVGFNLAFQGLGFAHGRNVAEEASTIAVKPTENTEILPTVTTPEKDGGNAIGKWFNRLFGEKQSTTDTTATDKEQIVKDSVIIRQQPEATDTLSSQAKVPIVETEEHHYELFPKTYTSREEMGISRAEYNILVQTTEGTLKSATGDEITLDRAYMNLEGSMENFPDKTKEEILYKFNRLYAFMRKAYDVGDGTLRETPSGTDYLENRFENLNLGLDDSKMGALVRFAQENTYADKKELTDGLKELFPEGLDNKTTSSVITIIHSNQRFYQYQEEMESLIKLLGCGDKISAEQAVAINALLDKTDEILSTGKENTQLTGLSLAKDCYDDDGEWKRVVTEQKHKPIVPPKPPVVNNEIDIEDDLVVPEEKINLAEEKLEVEPMPMPAPARAPEPEETQTGVRKVVVTGMSQLEGENPPEKEKILNERKARRLLKRYGQKTQE